MKLGEAIESSACLVNIEHTNLSKRQKNAIKLGIEALKARKVWQDYEGFDLNEALPGETKE